MSAFRTLPARPSLEFEKKEAKALLRRLQAGEPDALTRARERYEPFAQTPPDHFKLTDAQLIQAREYGFSSWPKLVRYFEALESQRLGRRWERSGGPGMNASQARHLLALHRDRKQWAARALAAFVPRYYCLKPEEVFALPPTEAEAQLAYARFHGAPNWEELNQQTLFTGQARDRFRDEIVALSDALDSLNIELFKRHVAEHRPLFIPEGPSSANGRSLPRMILGRERRLGREAMKPFVDWLVADGYDVQVELNLMLAGRMRVETEEIRWLLERGADPTWVAPNGIPILEHAMLIHWNAETVDLLAARATPRRALWTAAALGDQKGVESSLDSSGHPLRDSVRLRPPFDAVGALSLASQPDADDEELLAETLFVAAINGRIGVIKYLASRGAPIDSRVYGGTLLSVAVGNGWADVVEVLLDAGADLDLPTDDSNGTPREMGRSFFRPGDPARRRVAELCGWDPDQIPAEGAGPP